MSNETFQAKDLNLELLFDAAIVINRDGIIISVNGQACYLFGYDMDELVGKELDLLLPERLRENHHRHRKHYFANPTSRTMGTGLHLFGRRRDGTEFPIDVGLRPIMLEQTPHALAVIRDKTEIVAVQATFEQRIASFTSLSTSVEQLKQMIETQLSPIDTRVTIIEETVVPQIVSRVERIEEGMNEIKDQWKEVKPIFERVDNTYKHIDNFARHGRRIMYIGAGLIGTSIITQLVASFFHIFGR